MFPHHHHPQSVLESLNKGKTRALTEFTPVSELDVPYSHARWVSLLQYGKMCQNLILRFVYAGEN